MRRRIVLVSALVGLSSARLASAQLISQDAAGIGGLAIGMQRSGGFGGLAVNAEAARDTTPGLRLSDTFLLHAGVSAGAGVDSNVFYQDGTTTSAGMTRVAPRLDLTNAGRGSTPSTVFAFGVTGDYRQYFSDSSFVKQEASAFGVGASTMLDLSTHTPWGVTLFGNFIRDVQASYQPGSIEFSRDIVQPGARFRWRPGGGRFEELLTYSFAFDHFENGNLRLADTATHTINLRSNFRFLPKTALFLDISQSFIDYVNAAPGVGKFSSKPFRIVAGLQGLLTAKTTVEVHAGYGNGFYETGPSPSTFVGGASLAWIIGPFSRARIGYERSFNNSVFGNYYDLDSAIAAWDQQFGTSVLGGLGVRYEHRVYHCAPGQQNASIVCFQDLNGSDRVDNWLSFGANLNYFFTPWMSVGAAYQLLTNLSDFQLPSAAATDKVSFVKHQAVGFLTVVY